VDLLHGFVTVDLLHNGCYCGFVTVDLLLWFVAGFVTVDLLLWIYCGVCYCGFVTVDLHVSCFPASFSMKKVIFVVNFIVCVCVCVLFPLFK
jgi:hypothetical protein